MLKSTAAERYEKKTLSGQTVYFMVPIVPNDAQ